MVEEHCLPIPQFCPERSSRGSMRHFSLTAPAFIESVAELPVMHELHSKIDRGGRFIDVGAHIGFYTIAFSNCFDVVTSFEPSRFQYDFLKRNIETNVPNLTMYMVIKDLHTFYSCIYQSSDA